MPECIECEVSIPRETVAFGPGADGGVVENRRCPRCGGELVEDSEGVLFG